MLKSFSNTFDKSIAFLRVEGPGKGPRVNHQSRVVWFLNPWIVVLAINLGFHLNQRVEAGQPTDFTLNALVNPNGVETKATFDDSPNSNFGSAVQSIGRFTIGAGTSGVPGTGVIAASTRFWRVRVTNADGTVQSGAKGVFRGAVMPSHARGVKHGNLLVGDRNSLMDRHAMKPQSVDAALFAPFEAPTY